MDTFWVGKIKVEPINDYGKNKAILLVSSEEFNKINDLANECQKSWTNTFKVMSSGFIQTNIKTSWNEDKWHEGLFKIFGAYLPVIHHEYELRVVC